MQQITDLLQVAVALTSATLHDDHDAWSAMYAVAHELGIEQTLLATCSVVLALSSAIAAMTGSSVEDIFGAMRSPSQTTEATARCETVRLRGPHSR